MKKWIAIIALFIFLIISSLTVIFTNIFFLDDSLNDEDIVLIDNHLVEVSEPMNKQMVDYAINLFTRIDNEYVKDNNCYFVLIPDKYKYLADKSDDYYEFYDYMCASLDFATPIDIYEQLGSNDYYKTDPHWRQECIVDVADKINMEMGNSGKLIFDVNKVDIPFEGNYLRRINIDIEADELFCVKNDVVDNLYVNNDVLVYDYDKLSSSEQYDFFLSGNQSIVTIKNLLSTSDKRLIIFRDSFASSLAPLLSTDYSEIVLIDLRYVMSDLLKDRVDFNNADVLFIYSTTMINSSLSMK